uniref:Uncharacterized protein n=1 Tax=viral metagenome TaxID=1070528 RepID=A0A6C0KSJ3_9ZZZZ
MCNGVIKRFKIKINKFDFLQMNRIIIINENYVNWKNIVN